MTRERSTNVVDDAISCVYQAAVARPWSTYYDYDGGSYIPARIYKTMQDEVTYGFERLSAQGKIINNPMSKTHKTITESKGHMNWSARHYVQTYGGVRIYSGWDKVGDIASTYWLGDAAASTWYPSLPDVNVDNAESLAVTKAYANIDVSSAGLLETLGEGRETIVGLLDILRRVIKIRKAIKAWDVKALKGELKPRELANRYMEARYALRPLIYDAVKITKAITRPSKFGKRHTFRGYGEGQATTSRRNMRVGGGSYLDVYANSECIRTVQARAGVLVSVDPVSMFQIWGLDHPIEAMWELTPFSFIWDWFFNIGETISSFTPDYGCKPLSSWCVVTDQRVYTCQVVNATAKDPSYWESWTSEMTNCINTVVETHTTRTVHPPRSVVPVLNVRLDALKLLDLAIILRQLSSGDKIRKFVKV